GKQVRLVKAGGPVESVVFLGDGKRFLAAEEVVLALRETEGGKRLRQFAGHGNRIDRVALLPGETAALTVAQDGSARRWDLASGKEVARLNILPQTAPAPATGPR